MKTGCLQFALVLATLSLEASSLEIGSWRLQRAEAADDNDAHLSSLGAKTLEDGKEIIDDKSNTTRLSLRSQEAASGNNAEGVTEAKSNTTEAKSNTTRVSQWSQKVRSLSVKLCFPLSNFVWVGAPGRGSSSSSSNNRLDRDTAQGHTSSASPPKGTVVEEESSDMGPYIVSWLASEFVYLVLCGIVAYFYKAHKDWFLGQEVKEPSEKDFTKWTSPFLEPILFWSCVCPGVRWADSMSMSGVLPGYWQGFLLFFLMCVVTGLSLGLPGWILMTCFLTFFRMRLRSKFQMEQSLCFDFCGYCWCMPCLVAQEARHVEDAQMASAIPA